MVELGLCSSSGLISLVIWKVLAPTSFLIETSAVPQQSHHSPTSADMFMSLKDDNK